MQLDFTFPAPGDRPAPEPPAPAPEPRIFSVGELTRAVRTTLERAFGTVWVQGEISNLRRQASGHQYFTLKDDAAQLPCVLFAGTARTLRGLRLADGLQVQLFGELTVYEARGQYQLVVEIAQEVGQGALQARFEALKTRLAAEGLFAAERKRPLPRFPARIGVVTSPTGAAIRDFLHVLHRRMPGIDVVIHPVRVQGRGAAAEIARAIGDFSAAPENGVPAVEVIVVTRGGGSLEDLWEFNEEVVARAIAASRVPVVSAVGHEIDFTLSDFAADLRAPTPSAAAEILAADARELCRGLAQLAQRAGRVVAGTLRFQRARLAAHERSALFREPGRLVRERRQALDVSIDALRFGVATAVRGRRDSLRHALAVIAAHRPSAAFTLRRQRLERERSALTDATRRRLGRAAERLAAAQGLLRSLSPEATLARGYSITFDAAGRPVRDAAAAPVGAELRVRFARGEADVEVRRSRSAR